MWARVRNQVSPFCLEKQLGSGAPLPCKQTFFTHTPEIQLPSNFLVWSQIPLLADGISHAPPARAYKDQPDAVKPTGSDELCAGSIIHLPVQFMAQKHPLFNKPPLSKINSRLATRWLWLKHRTSPDPQLVEIQQYLRIDGFLILRCTSVVLSALDNLPAPTFCENRYPDILWRPR